MAWSPDARVMARFVHVLRASLSHSPETQYNVKAHMQSLERQLWAGTPDLAAADGRMGDSYLSDGASRTWDFPLYLAAIFAAPPVAPIGISPPDLELAQSLSCAEIGDENFCDLSRYPEVWAAVRAVAGYGLKAFLDRARSSFNDNFGGDNFGSQELLAQLSGVIGYVRATVAAMLDSTHYVFQSEQLADSMRELRDAQAAGDAALESAALERMPKILGRNLENALGTLLAALYRQGGAQSWPELVPTLANAVEHIARQAEASPLVAIHEPSAAPYADPLKDELGLVALQSLKFVLEDDAPQLASPPDTDRSAPPPLDLVLPRIVPLMLHQRAEVRELALDCVIEVLSLASPGLLGCLQAIVANVFALAQDSTLAIRARVVRALNALLATKADYIAGNMEELIQFALEQTQVDDEDVAIEACEFWCVLAEIDEDESLLTPPVLSRLVPLLLQKMVYTDDDIIDFVSPEAYDSGNAAAVNTAKNRQELAPSFARGAAGRGFGLVGSDTAAERNSGDTVFEIRSADEEDELRIAQTKSFEDEEDAEAAQRAQEARSVRRSAAAAIDTIGTLAEPDVLVPIIFPLIEQHLNFFCSEENWDQEWRVREVGIITLGAIADGCHDALSPHLGSLIDFLCQKTLLPDVFPPEVVVMSQDDLDVTQEVQIAQIASSHVHPLLRSISCWCLGRYAKFIADNARGILPSQQIDGSETLLITTVIDRLLRCTTESHLRTQEAAISALAVVIQHSHESLDLLAPIMPYICTTLASLFPRFDGKRMILLFDTVATIAESGVMADDPQLLQIIMPQVVLRWGTVSLNDPAACPLFEMLAGLTTALELAFAPFAVPVYEHSCEVIRTILLQDAAFNDEIRDRRRRRSAGQALAQDSEIMLPPEKEVLISALELVASLFCALGPDSMDAFWPAITHADGDPPEALQLAAQACTDRVRLDVRQAAITTIGDIAAAGGHRIGVFAPTLMPLCLSELDPDMHQLCQNSLWCVAELCGSVYKLSARSAALNDEEGAAASVQASMEICDRLPEAAPRLLDLMVLMIGDGGPTKRTTPEIRRLLATNAALALSQFCAVCPTEMANAGMDSLFPALCSVVRTIPDSSEKEDACRGVAAVFGTAVEQQVPNAFAHVMAFLDLILSLEQPQPEIHSIFRTTLEQVAQAAAVQSARAPELNMWHQVIGSLPPPVLQQLQSRYPDVVSL